MKLTSHILDRISAPSYKLRLFLYFFAVFAIFTFIVIAYQQYRERVYKREIVEAQLDQYTYGIEALLLNDSIELCATVPHEDSIIQSSLRNFKTLLPTQLRITILDRSGNVVYDNNTSGTTTIMGNHLERPEVQQAIANATKHGSDIRYSETLDQPYLYFARCIDSGYIRVALPYNAITQSLLRADQTFLCIALFLFAIALYLLWQVSKRFGNDVEELKQHLIDEQHEKSVMKSELTSAISHELRIPVSAIRGYTETLLDPDMDEATRKAFTQRTNVAAIRLSELLKDISLLTKIEEMSGSFKHENVDIKQLVDLVLDEFETQIHDASITINTSIPEGTVVNGSKTLLGSIFQNLTSNAIKYAGKWVTINIALTHQDDAYYYFEVSDNGVGIPVQDLPHIFERFYRTKGSGRTREDGGSGLGLAIVRHAVLHHGGDIAAQNQETGGLKISFSIRKDGASMA